MMNEKRGLSVVVASVLLVLLTISAVAIVANFIIPFTDKSLEKTECFKFRDYFSFDDSFNYNCYDKTNKVYVLTVKARPDSSGSDKITGFKFKLVGGGNAITVDGNAGDPESNLKMIDARLGNGKIIIPSSADKYSTLSYNYSSNEIYDKVEIYPVLKGERICEQSDSLQISEC